LLSPYKLDIFNVKTDDYLVNAEENDYSLLFKYFV